MRKFLFVFLMSTLVGLLPSFAQEEGSVITDAPIGVAILDDYVAGLVTIDVTINGETMPFLFDTGGGVTLITPEFAERIECVPWGNRIGFRMNGEALDSQVCGDMVLDIDGTEFTDEVGVFDLMSLLPPDLPAVGGILSLTPFQNIAISLDLAAGELIFESEGSLQARTNVSDGSEMRLQREMSGSGISVFVPIATDPGPLWLLVDSANLVSFILAPHAEEILRDSGMLTNGPDGAMQVGVELAGVEFTDLNASVRPIIYDGVVDHATLLQMIITVDFRSSEYWVTKHSSE